MRSRAQDAKCKAQGVMDPEFFFRGKSLTTKATKDGTKEHYGWCREQSAGRRVKSAESKGGIIFSFVVEV